MIPARPKCSLPENGPQAPYLLPDGGVGWVGWVETRWKRPRLAGLSPHTPLVHSVDRSNHVQSRTGVVEQDVVPLLVGLVAGLGAGPAGMRRRLVREQQHGGGDTEQQLHWSRVVMGWVA